MSALPFRVLGQFGVGVVLLEFGELEAPPAGPVRIGVCCFGDDGHVGHDRIAATRSGTPAACCASWRPSSGWSSRVWPPRLSVRCSAALATHSLTSSMLRMSIARCQPGLKTRPPSTVDVVQPRLELVELGQRLLDLVFLADDADQVVHRLLQLGVQRVRVLRVRRGRRTATAPCAVADVESPRRRPPADSTAPARSRRRPARRAGRTPAGPTASCRRAGWSRACRRSTRPPRTAPVCWRRRCPDRPRCRPSRSDRSDRPPSRPW